MERMVLATAELSFLISIAPNDRQPDAVRRLRLPDEERVDAVVRAGVGSLAARGLAVPDQGQLRLAPVVLAVLRDLTEPAVWAEVAAVSPAGTDLVQFFAHPEGRIVLAPRALGLFEVSGVALDVPVAEPLLGFAREALTRPAPTTVIVRTEQAGGATEVALASLPDGGFAVTAGSPGPALSTLDEAIATAQRHLAEVTA